MGLEAHSWAFARRRWPIGQQLNNLEPQRAQRTQRETWSCFFPDHASGSSLFVLCALCVLCGSAASRAACNAQARHRFAARRPLRRGRLHSPLATLACWPARARPSPSEVLRSEGAPGVRLQVLLEGKCLLARAKGDGRLCLPRSELRRVGTLPRIVGLEPLAQVLCPARVVTARLRQADKDVNIVESAVCPMACQGEVRREQESR